MSSIYLWILFNYKATFLIIRQTYIALARWKRDGWAPFDPRSIVVNNAGL